MHGNDRIYTSMGPEIEQMYKNAKNYKGNKNSKIANSNTEMLTTSESIRTTELSSNNDIIKYYF